MRYKLMTNAPYPIPPSQLLKHVDSFIGVGVYAYLVENYLSLADQPPTLENISFFTESKLDDRRDIEIALEQLVAAGLVEEIIDAELVEEVRP
jgi:hypothetical protein